MEDIFAVWTASSGEEAIRILRERDVGVIADSDTGPGIAEDDIGRVFDPYFSTRNESRVVGLVIVQRLAGQSGGEVAVDSTGGLGATFTLTLPLADFEITGCLVSDRPAR